MSVVIRRAVPSDVPYVVDQGRKEFERIGFLSRSAYEGIVTGIGAFGQPRHRLWIADVDGEQVGFLYASPGGVGRSLKIVQVCIRADARRVEFGQALVEVAEDYAARLQRPAVSCSVATDLEARAFWDALGYELRAVVPGGGRRRRMLERRYKCLPCGLWTEAGA